MHTRLILLLALALNVPLLRGQEYQGAEAILRKITEQADSEIPEKKADPLSELQEKIKVFAKSSHKLSPEEAAKQWLALYDAYLTIPMEMIYRQTGSANDRIDTEKLLSVLPPPFAWDAIASSIEKRAAASKQLKDAGLPLLAAVLRGDGPARKKAFDSILKFIKEQKMEDYQRQNLEQTIAYAADSLNTFAGTDAEKIIAFETLLTKYEDKNPATPFRGQDIAIPDLVQLGGKEKAKALIVRALKLDGGVQVEGNLTRRFTAELALENIKDLKKPVWDLVETAAELPLYEALAKKFPKSESSAAFERNQADTIYLLHLIANNKTKEATRFALEAVSRQSDATFSLSTQAVDDMQKQGFGTQVVAFLKEMLTLNPALPFWETYIQLSAHEGASDVALISLQDALKKPELVEPARAAVQEQYYRALLAADKIDEGIEVLRAVIKAGPASASSDGSAEAEATKKQWEQLGVNVSPEMLRSMQMRNFNQSSQETDYLKTVFVLAKLGTLLQRPELIAEGLKVAKETYAKIPTGNGQSEAALPALASELVDIGHGVEAESLIADALVRLAKPDPALRGRQSSVSLSLLTQLTQIYHQAGRSEDVLRLLNESPLWAYPDLSMLETQNANAVPLMLIAAEALEKTGNKEAALKVTQRLVQNYPSNDAGYVLLLKLEKTGLESRLDKLFEANRFEERPLIWKAQVQLDAGKIDDAEKTIRAAIAIDPSDGEQGKNNRMRAYAVLADILDKKGDAAQAKTMRGAVKAIRISENADDWWNAGLLTRAVKMYEEALTQFADAYCVQSRLALRYSELGDYAKAEMHYQRAFELMPDSFGRVESHCFGCEGAFKGKRAQNVAEKVFAQLALKQPNRPQVFYLLGYLRDQQGRYQEAADHYRRAVKLDPDYLNAWKKLSDLSERIEMPSAERDKAVLELFRLDPVGHESSPSLNKLTNLRELWQVVLDAEDSLPQPETGNIYPLAAAKDVWDKRSKEQTMYDPPSFFSRRANVRAQFTSNVLISTTTSLLENLNRSNSGY